MLLEQNSELSYRNQPLFTKTCMKTGLPDEIQQGPIMPTQADSQRANSSSI